MAKKNNNNGVENKNKNNDTNNNDGGEKKEDGSIASKIVKWVKPFQGAESVKSEGQENNLTVVGKVDPTELRDELASKTKNKVDLVSPQPKKDNKVNKDDANDTKKMQPEKTDDDDDIEAHLFLSKLRSLFLSKPEGPYSVSGNDGNDDDGNGSGGGGVGDEKNKEEDEGNGGGKMKYPVGQSGFGRFSCGTVYRHGYGYQNGALKTLTHHLLYI